MKRLVLLGGGHAHLFVLERFARQRLAAVEVILVSPSDAQVYSGMLPGWIAGAYRLEACSIPLAGLAGRAGARLVRQACVRLDAAARTVETADGRRIEYDRLSIDAGAATAIHAIPGAATFATPVRPLDGFIGAIERVFADAAAGRECDALVVGGGAAGVEIAFALQARLAVIGRRDARVAVVGTAARPLDGLPRIVQWRARRLMRDRGIEWHGGRRVCAITADGALLDDGSGLGARHVFLATGAAAHPWIAASGLATDREGYARVDATLRSVSHPQVFAAGDCAAYATPRPKSGVFAVRAGPPLAENLLRSLAGEPLRAWRPQRRALYLVSTGTGAALGARGVVGWWGAWVWRWKDRIDRRFVERFRASGDGSTR
ncbi:FAD-dependent oxidoreductase [Aromatoleum sp.]|uniref:FAD-dependent oxidoreductase n=1 Tax=Aromatoleum sp. TaxID=2307007 RepID=UPI002FCCB73D